MTFFRVFSALTMDTGCRFYDETECVSRMTEDIYSLVREGSDFSVRIYSSRHEWKNGANPYAVLTYVSGDDAVYDVDKCPDTSYRIDVIPGNPVCVSERVGARVRRLAKWYAEVC